MKKTIKTIIICVVVIAIVAATNLFGPSVLDKFGSENVVTESRLEKAINIDKLSTAEFVYNGVAEKYRDDNSEKIDCYISYKSTVKVGINMSDIKFKIDKEKKTVTPALPEVSINIAAIDEDGISYIPKNPDIDLKEVISICRKDAVDEANNSEQLKETAKENLKNVVEVLLKPLLESNGYSIAWN